MPLNRDFAVFIEDMLRPLGPVFVRAMFGGGGVYREGIMFALIADDVLYFKADEESLPAFEAEGMTPFVFAGRGKPVIMSYWQVPERLYDDAEELTVWAQRAFDAAQRQKAGKGRTRGKRADR